MPRGISLYDEARLQGRLWTPAKGATSYVPARAANDLTNNFWGTASGSAPTVAANAAIAPDGTQTASSISIAVNSQYDGQASIPGGTASKKMRCVVWLKSATGSNQNIQIKNTQGLVIDNWLTVSVTPTWQEFALQVTNGSSGGNGIQRAGLGNPSAAASLYVWNYRLYDVTNTFPFEDSKLTAWTLWAQGLQPYLPASNPYANRPPLIGG